MLFLHREIFHLRDLAIDAMGGNKVYDRRQKHLPTGITLPYPPPEIRRSHIVVDGLEQVNPRALP